MISKKSIMKMFPMRNCLPFDFAKTEYDDLYHTRLIVLENRSKSKTTINLNIPKIDKNGIFMINGIYRQLCFTLRPNPMFNNRCMDIRYTYLETPEDLLIRFVEQAYNLHLTSLYMLGHQNQPQLAQQQLDTLLKTSRLSHVIKGLATNYKPKISLELNQKTTDEFMPFNTEGILDWTSISQSSNNCGKTMYLSEQCKIDENGGFTKRGRIYCDILNKNLILPEYNRRRTTASNFKSSSKLVKSEDPVTYPDDYDNHLSGRHLLTVHGIIPGVYKEQIVMSKSAAKKMACIIPEQQTFVIPGWCKNSFVINVKEKEYVKPNQVIGKYIDNKAQIPLVAHIRRESRIDSIQNIKSRVAEKESLKILITYSRTHNLRDGDKITNRHGNKGIVKIVPDKLMPTVNGDYAEVVTNALATLRRRNPGQIVEAMLNSLAESMGPAPVPHFLEGNDRNIPKALIKECLPQEHEYNGQKVMAWSGKVFWIVLDKFSHQTNTYVTERPDSEDGMYANIGKLSGTRIYLTVMQIMLSKGWKNLLYRLIDENATGIDRIQKYIYCMYN